MGTVTVEIDVDDVIDQISDKQLAAEYAARELDKTRGPSAREIVSHAVVMAKTGRVDDAITLLEREFMPRWKDVADCSAAYSHAMALKAAA